MSNRLLWPDLEPEAVAEGWLGDVPTMTTADVLAALANRLDAVAIGLVPSVKYARVVYEVKVSRADWLRELRPIPDIVEDLGHGPRRMDPRRARRVAAVLAEPTEDNARARGWWTVAGEYHKWDAALEVSTEFWVAAPPKCVLVSELPPEAGLVEVRPWGTDRVPRARVIRPAPIRETPTPDAGFWAAVLRRAAERRPTP